MDNIKALDFLKDTIKIDSTLGNEKEVADLFSKVLDEYGIKNEQVEYAPGRNQLIATLGEGSPVLGYSGHMDVVPTGDIEWDYDAFGAQEVDGRLYGRGTVDMKAGLVATLVAAIRLKEAGYPKKGTLKLLCTVGEETAGIGAQQLVELGYGDNLDALVIAEPTNLQIAYAHKGALWPRITSLGKTAHGSMPQEGVNAIESMIKIIEKIKEEFDFSASSDSELGQSTSSINVLKGGNGTNVVPDKAVCEIDIRTVPCQDHEELKGKFQAILDDLAKEDETFKAEVEYINDLPSMRTEKEDPFVDLAEAATEKITGTKPKLVTMTGYTDASQFTRSKKSYPKLILGPGETKYAHQPNENVIIEDFYKSIEIYEEIGKEFLK